MEENIPPLPGGGKDVNFLLGSVQSVSSLSGKWGLQRSLDGYQVLEVGISHPPPSQKSGESDWTPRSGYIKFAETSDTCARKAG